MFKTRLQELCHQRKWALPNYSCVKVGPEHSPLFRASVLVDGVSFDSPAAAKSGKEAQNEAAKLAFFRLTSGIEGIEVDMRSQFISNSSVKAGAEPTVEGIEVDRSSQFNSNSFVKTGAHHQYKLHLQQLAQRKKLDPPVYSCKKEGPPHALQFQATVTIGGQSFDSPGYFRNLKEAENAASKVAFLTLSLDMQQEIDVQSSKNLLQDLTQSEGLAYPEYKTVAHGPPHERTFFSSVYVEGEVFHGEGRKSKKLAELSAAKAAYLSFMKCESTCNTEFTPSRGPTFEEMTNSFTSSSSSQRSAGYATENEDEEEDFVQKSLAILKGNTEGQSSAATFAPPDISSLSITAPKIKNNVEAGNYLLNNKARVYTSIPTKLPEGTVLLPIDEDKWMAVSLEFPNHIVN